MSLDGKHWAIRYSLAEDARFRNSGSVADATLHYSPVATIEHGAVKMQAVHPFLASDDVRSAVNRLREALSRARLPFPAADRVEAQLRRTTTNA